jgi:hypothetical protein
MARVFDSVRTGAEVVVFSHDHCPPHVTARHHAEAWVARIKLSFVTDLVTLWDVEPVKNAPRLRDLNELLDEVEDKLVACRRQWWLIHGTACIRNRWARNATSTLDLLEKKQPGARQIASERH